LLPKASTLATVGTVLSRGLNFKSFSFKTLSPALILLSDNLYSAWFSNWCLRVNVTERPSSETTAVSTSGSLVPVIE